MRGKLVYVTVVMGLLLVAGFVAREAYAADANSVPPHKYVGAIKCKTCHKKDLIGNQYKEWQKGKHAEAFETLKSPDAAKIAEEKGLTVPAYESPDCLKCHVTAYGLPAAAFASKPLKNSDAIQCESCHGPGNDYKKKKTMADRDKAIAAGMWEPGKDEKICTTCHNDESPTWDPKDGFDFEKRKEKIAHPIPEDVKGKYIETEKRLKAEKRAAGGGDDDDEDEEEEE